jgi:ABC-type transport system substrate-binding protein
MELHSYWESISRGRVARRRLLKRAGAAGVAIGGAAALAGCSSPAAAPTPATAVATATPGAPASGAAPSPAAPQAKYGGSFRWSNSGEAANQDPHLNDSALFHYLGVGVVYSRLLKFKTGKDVPVPSFIPTGDMAASWEQADELTYTLKLRPGIKWQNISPVSGRELTADDIVYSHNRIRDLKVNAHYIYDIDKTVAMDKSTIRITALKPDADFLIELADNRNKIVAREAVEKSGDLKDGPTIGTGPWIFDKWEPNTVAAVVRNPDYFLKGLPYLDRLEFIRITDDATRQSAFLGKNLEAFSVGLTIKTVESIKQRIPDAVAKTVRSLGSGIELGARTDRPPTSDIRVRQAISKALDRPGAIETLDFGTSWLSAGITLPSFDWALPEDEAKRLLQRDLAGAKRLLTEAGYLNGFDIEMTVPNYGTYYTTAGELAASQLREAGINATVKVLDPVGYVSKVLTDGDFQLYVGPTNPILSANSDLFARHHSKGDRNATKINDPKLDAMIEQQSVMTKDPDGRKRLLMDIQRYIINSAHLQMINTSGGNTIMQGYVRDFYPGVATSSEYDQYTPVWLDK